MRPKWRCIWQKKKKLYQHKHLTPTAMEGGRGVMICARFAVTGPGHLAVIELTINSSIYQSSVESNMRPFIQQLKLAELDHAREQ